MQFGLSFESKCNYWATLEGVVLGHHLREWLKQRDGTGFGRIIAFSFLLQELVFNGVDDLIVLMAAFQSLSTRGGDIFDAGLILGKLSKITLQLYLEGILFKGYQDF